MPGTSSRVIIRIPPLKDSSVLRYEVTNDDGALVQQKEFKLIPQLGRVDWYLEVPWRYRRPYLRISVEIDSESLRLSNSWEIPVESLLQGEP